MRNYFNCISEDDSFLSNPTSFAFGTGGVFGSISLTSETDAKEVYSFDELRNTGNVESKNSLNDELYPHAGLVVGWATEGSPILAMPGTYESAENCTLNGKMPAKSWDNGAINGTVSGKDFSQLQTQDPGKTDPDEPTQPADPGNNDQKDQTVTTKSVQMYRLYNPNSGEHFYTSDQHERKTLIGLGWKDEGNAWVSPETSGTPVYRLYNPNAGDHHYTTSAHERDVLKAAGWNDEGIGWYSEDSKSTSVWRLYNPNATGAGAHHYTTDFNEYNTLSSLGWKQEGVGWYGL